MSAQRRRLILGLLVAATVIPTIVLGWLGWRVFEQDRDVERAAERQALEVAAGRFALDVERRLQHTEERLAGGEGMIFLPDGVSSHDSPLLYQPQSSLARAPELPPAVFLAAEIAEYQSVDFDTASATYRRLARSSQPAVRGGALIRLARVLRKSGDQAGAVAAYSELEELGTLSLGGQPAALVSRQGRARAFEEAGDRSGLEREARELGRLLNAGGWPIDRATFELYADLLKGWGVHAPADQAAVVRTEAAIRLWESWREGNLTPRGRQIVPDLGEPVLAIWTGGPDRPVAWLTTMHDFDAYLQPLWSSHGLIGWGSDLDGRELFGEGVAGAVAVLPAESRLPFVISVAADGQHTKLRVSSRRTLLLSGLVVAFVAMSAAAYGAYRATSSELRLARQQTDFVSAVSHEFRTPLTSMRHLLDLLATRAVASDERRGHYYQLLTQETERLQRLVESLLSFGRIEAGSYAWRREPLAPRDLISAVVADFRRDQLAAGRSISCDVEEDLAALEVDREAVSRSLWNLVENAAKYSPAGAEIRVFAWRDADSVRIGVVDRGVGIQPEEQQRIFQKFVRGSDARHSGVRGVGIGLALADQVVKAHGGRIEVESTPGEGSTFTIVLPISGSGQSMQTLVSSKVKAAIKIESEV